MEISGTYDMSADVAWSYVQTDELRLDCDTSTAPVIINLPSISTLLADRDIELLKLFITDVSGNASVNNITINADGTDVIKGGSDPIVIAIDGGVCKLEIANETTWLATGDQDGTLTSYDSGWKAIPQYDGVRTYGVAAVGVAPSFRIVNREVFIEGSMVLPLAVGGVLQANASLYAATASNELYTGAAGGYTIGASGFVRSVLPILPATLLPAVSTPAEGNIGFIKRTIFLSDAVTKYPMTAPVLNSPNIGSDGLIRLFLLQYIESDNLASSFPYSDLRRASSKFASGDGVIDMSTYKNSYTAAVIQQLQPELGGGITFPFAFDPEEMAQYGGFAYNFKTSYLINEGTSLAAIKAAFDAIP